MNNWQTKAKGENCVKISYKNLWHLLLDKNMNKADLKRVTGISTATIAKLDKGQNVTTDILVRICEALDCDLDDIMEISREDNQNTPQGF